MNKPRILIILAIVIILGTVYISFQGPNMRILERLLNPDQTSAEYGDDTPPKDEFQGSEEYYSESGSGSQDYKNSLGQTCSLIPLPYSLKNFIKTSECVSFEGEDCVENKVICLVDVTNLDHEYSGEFEIKAEFFETIGEVIETKITSGNINSREMKTFDNSMIFTGENAKKQITCSMATNNVPRKEMCS